MARLGSIKPDIHHNTYYSSFVRFNKEIHFRTSVHGITSAEDTSQVSSFLLLSLFQWRPDEVPFFHCRCITLLIFFDLRIVPVQLQFATFRDNELDIGGLFHDVRKDDPSAGVRVLLWILRITSIERMLLVRWMERWLARILHQLQSFPIRLRMKPLVSSCVQQIIANDLKMFSRWRKWRDNDVSELDERYLRLFSRIWHNWLCGETASRKTWQWRKLRNFKTSSAENLFNVFRVHLTEFLQSFVLQKANFRLP